MSRQFLRRRVPTISGLASGVETLRESSTAPQPITTPPNDVSLPHPRPYKTSFHSLGPRLQRRRFLSDCVLI